MRSVCIIGLIVIFAAGSFAQSKKANASARGERLITALKNSKTIPGLYGDDGFGHIEMSPDVIRIFHLGKRAIPLLIDHLDDRRTFKHMMFYGDLSGPKKVTVGEGVLELLGYIIREEAPFFDMACIHSEDRTEDRCVADGFSFGRRGKRNWLKAYHAGKIHYRKSEY